MPRPTWDEYFGEIAHTVSLRASCPRASVGAVIVRDNRILATGYNGAPTGKPQCDEDDCVVVDNHCQRAIHAEVNAIAHAARAGVSVEGADLYLYSNHKTTKGMCRECTKVVTAAGLKNVSVFSPKNLDNLLD